MPVTLSFLLDLCTLHHFFFAATQALMQSSHVMIGTFSSTNINFFHHSSSLQFCSSTQKIVNCKHLNRKRTLSHFCQPSYVPWVNKRSLIWHGEVATSIYCSRKSAEIDGLVDASAILAIMARNLWLRNHFSCHITLLEGHRQRKITHVFGRNLISILSPLRKFWLPTSLGKLCKWNLLRSHGKREGKKSFLRMTNGLCSLCLAADLSCDDGSSRSFSEKCIYVFVFHTFVKKWINENHKNFHVSSTAQ